MLKFALAILVFLSNQAFAVEVSEDALKGSWKIVRYNDKPYEDDDRWEYSGSHMSQVTYSPDGKVHLMSPSVFYITEGHLLEFDFGKVDVMQLDKKTMAISVSGSDFVFEKISDRVYVKPKAKEKIVSKEVAETVSGMAEGLFGTGEENAEALNCSKAVKDTWRFLDQALLQGEINFNDGYSTRQQLADSGKKLNALRNAINVKSCESSEGNVKDFYLCLSNPDNIVLYCGQKYKFQVP